MPLCAKLFGADSPGTRRRGFTLVEMCAASAVSLLVIATLLAILNHVSGVWVRTRGTKDAFLAASNAFDSLTRSLSQAVLQTYWSYDNPSLPQKYVRASELHFVLGKTAKLFGVQESSYPGSAVFFQAPLGRTATGRTSQLPARLNATGYFTAFGKDPRLPAILESIVTHRYRFRLFEWKQPTDSLAVYQTPAGSAWFQQVLSPEMQGEANVASIGENILGLFILAEYPLANGMWEQTNSYDSRDTSGPDTLNQLPPQLQIALVAIDEPSAARLAARYGSTPPLIAPPGDAFQNPAHFDSDLANWESALRADTPPVNCRIFRTTIQIPNSRWSTK